MPKFIDSLVRRSGKRKLVRQMKKQHQHLLDGLRDVQSLGVTTPGAKDKLFKIKELLLTHVKLEDELLYPGLRASADPEAQRLAELFESEMEDISKDAIAFFEKYVEADHGTSFSRDIAHLILGIRKRIEAEESLLYPAYEEHGVYLDKTG